MIKVYLILFSDINCSDLLNSPSLKVLKEKGVICNFREFFPLETKSGLTYALTGCNLGKVGFLDIAGDFSRFKNSKGFDKTIISLLLERNFSIEYLVNNLPTMNADFSFVYLSNLQLLDKLFDYIIKKEGAYIFFIAPTLEGYAEKAVNINNFLREKEIIETNNNGEIIWENSLAYQEGHGYLWVNLIGRQPKGAVLPGEEYNDVREALIKGIMGKLVDGESRQPVVEQIYKKEELFNGEYLFKMPDLIVSLKKEYGFSNPDNEPPIFDGSAVYKKRTKVYTAGVGIVVGENIKKGMKCKDVAITSIVPSILHCMGCSIPSWIDGKVEEQIFTEDFMTDNPPKYDDEQGASVLSEKDEALIQERLKSLGYL